MRPAISWVGRVLGALSGAGAAVLWIFALWFPSSAGTLAGINLVVVLLMALIALFVLIASIYGHGPVLIFAFLASFFPIGFGLLGAEHWLSWIGRLNIGYLCAGLLLLLGRPVRAQS